MVNKRTKNNKKKSSIAFKLAMVFIVLIMFIGGCVLGYFASALNWFKKKPETPEVKEQGFVLDGGGNELLTDGTEQAMPERMVFGVRSLSATNEVDPQATTTNVTLTATIEPADADNQAVTWITRWKDSESEWATGKIVTSYMTVAPISEGSLTATVTCLKDFGEQIEVVVASVENPDYTAICTCDYVKLLTGITVTATESPIVLESEEEGSVFEIVPSWSDGTITSEMRTVANQLTPNAGVKMKFSAEFGTEFDKYCSYGAGVLLTYMPCQWSFYSKNFRNDLLELLYGGAPNMDSVYNAFKNAVNNVSSNHVHILVTAVNVYDGKIIGEVTGGTDITLDGSALEVKVTGITLDTTTWVVGG